MRRWLSVLILIAAPVIAWAADSYQVNSGATVDITEHSTCRKVTNGHASGSPLFVPTKTSTEWSSFYGSTIPGITIATCAPACSGVSMGGYCWYAGSATVNQSCTTVCTSRGGTTEGTISYTGTGGNSTNCQNVVTALGGPGFVLAVQYVSAIGCSFDGGGATHDIGQPTTHAAVHAGMGTQRRVCSCVN